LVAFEHNKILWFIASLASLMTILCSDYYILSSKSSEVRQNKSHSFESPALITFPLIVLGSSNIRGLISSDKQLAERISGSIIYKVATENTTLEHPNLLMLVAVIGGLVGIGYLCKIHKAKSSS
jgi:NADH-quinone oxidoreductase subunit L